MPKNLLKQRADLFRTLCGLCVCALNCPKPPNPQTRKTDKTSFQRMQLRQRVGIAKGLCIIGLIECDVNRVVL